VNDPAATAWLVVVAAGRGERLGAGVSKSLVALDGRPLFSYSIESAAASDAFAGVILVAGDPAVGAACERLSMRARAVLRDVVAGGARRCDSVRAGLVAVRGAVGGAAAVAGAPFSAPAFPVADPATLVHDAARPFAPPDLLAAAARAAGSGAVVCGRCAADTVKRLDGERVIETLPRETVFLAETPQGAPLSWLERAHAMSGAEDASDDSQLLERAGADVRPLFTSAPNFKVTTAADLALAEAWVRAGGAPWMHGNEGGDGRSRGTAGRARL
jgi:2-C-methyl-D-erythritol 4-phosphate cytidylyltransferase